MVSEAITETETTKDNKRKADLSVNDKEHKEKKRRLNRRSLSEKPSDEEDFEEVAANQGRKYNEDIPVRQTKNDLSKGVLLVF